MFQAIVQASIQQLEAYGDLLKGVARSVDQFAKDNVSADRARDWLSRTYTQLSDGADDSDDEQATRQAATTMAMDFMVPSETPAGGLRRKRQIRYHPDG